MKVAFTPAAWEEYQYWQENDKQTLTKINTLIKDIIRNPFRGPGKPEALKNNLAGYWSRRISGEHRIVYRISGTKPDQLLTIVQLRFHY